MRDRKAFRSFVGCANINWFIKIVSIPRSIKIYGSLAARTRYVERRC